MCSPVRCCWPWSSRGCCWSWSERTSSLEDGLLSAGSRSVGFICVAQTNKPYTHSVPTPAMALDFWLWFRYFCDFLVERGRFIFTDNKSGFTSLQTMEALLTGQTGGITGNQTQRGITTALCLQEVLCPDRTRCCPEGHLCSTDGRSCVKTGETLCCNLYEETAVETVSCYLCCLHGCSLTLPTLVLWMNLCSNEARLPRPLQQDAASHR